MRCHSSGRDVAWKDGKNKQNQHVRATSSRRFPALTSSVNFGKVAPFLAVCFPAVPSGRLRARCTWAEMEFHHVRFAIRRLVVLFALTAFVIAAPGCTIWNRLRGKNVEESAPDASAEYSTQFRPRASDSQPYFLDDRARQIERNLGL
ncbi:MAG: hypothetical protein U0939_14130 [Pirellulales bacterium]